MKYKVTVVQPLLPYYSISFFNKIVENNPNIELVILADIHTDQQLNQYDKKDCKFKVVNLKSKNIFGFVIRPKLKRILLNEKSNTVIFSGNPRDISQIISIIYFFLRKKKIFAWGMFHRIGRQKKMTILYYKLVSALVNKCLTYSGIGARNLISIGVKKHKVKIVGTAIDEKIPFLFQKNKTKEELDSFKKIEELEHKKIILQVVRLSKIKKPELLILAAELLVKKHNDLIFVLIGDGELRDQIELLIHQKNLQNNFRLLGAVYDENILSSWFMLSKIFVVPTCIGLSLHHAMSYGLPVITDNSLDCQASESDIISDGLNGIFYDEGSPDSLAEKIEKLLLDESLRAKISQNAKFTIANKYNLNNKANNFVKFLSINK